MKYFSTLKFFYLALFISIGAVSLYALTVQATERNCGLYNSSTPPAGYGAAYNVFSPSQVLVRVFCDDNNHDLVTLHVGTGGTSQVLYQKGYHYGSGRWHELTLTGTARYGGPTSPWFIGPAQLTLPASMLHTGVNYVVAYVCVDQGGQWKCGCSDTACATGKWQLQAFNKQAAEEEPECVQNSDCPLNQVCFIYAELPEYSGRCVIDCTGNDSICPADKYCYRVPGQTTSVCLPPGA